MRVFTKSGERKRFSFVALTLATSAGLLVAASLHALGNEIREMKSDRKLPYSYLPIKLLYRYHSSHGADPFVIVGKDNTHLFVDDSDEKFMMDASSSSEALWGNNEDHSPDFSKAKGFCLKVQLKMRQTGYEIVDMGIFPRGSIIRCPTTSPNLPHQP